MIILLEALLLILSSDAPEQRW